MKWTKNYFCPGDHITMNIKSIIWGAFLIFTTWCYADDTTIIKAGNYAIVINSAGFKFHFAGIDGRILAPAHAVTGMSIDGESVVSATPQDQKGAFVVATEKGVKAEVSIALVDGLATFTVVPLKREDEHTVQLQLGGMPVAHGLGDAGGCSGNFNLIGNKARTFTLGNNGGTHRWASSFVIFPHNQLAGVAFGSDPISVTFGPDEYSMLVKRQGIITFNYFLGEPTAIYQNYLDLRIRQGYPNIKPKFTFFELGWESWAALGWKANAEAVKAAIEKLQTGGFPIRWAVTGSGFWDKGGTTTSFGRFGDSFPDPAGFRAWARKHNVKWIIGLRTNFVPSGEDREATSKKRDKNLDTKVYYGNPLSDEGVEKGYFVSDGTHLKTYTSRYFPQVPCYLVDGRKPDAARWFADLYRQWSVDGIKEDTMMRCNFGIFNAPIANISEGGGLVMARCGSFSAPGTLLRINDTHGAGPMADRTPINYLQYAASGAPNVYSDTIGFNNTESEQNIRHGWLMSCTAGLAMSQFTWKNPKLIQGFKRMIQFHYEIAPTLYDAAMKSYQTGYPYTMTPLDIAYPGDTMASTTSTFEWLIGESLLAVPLVKNYASGKLDIYLPEGIWFDYDTGKKYQGPTTLRDFLMPLDKTPCFVGGKGIIVTRTSDDAQLTAKIYPNAKDNTVHIFNHPDGESKSVITIEQRKDQPSVIDATDEREVPVVLNKESGAVSFKVLPGHDYRFGKSHD